MQQLWIVFALVVYNRKLGTLAADFLEHCRHNRTAYSLPKGMVLYARYDREILLHELADSLEEWKPFLTELGPRGRYVIHSGCARNRTETKVAAGKKMITREIACFFHALYSGRKNPRMIGTRCLRILQNIHR